MTRSPMRNILLTGSTGFIGSPLLSRVLTEFPLARVYCLVRGKIPSHCVERVVTAWESLHVDVDATAWDRIVGVPGGIVKLHFRLSATGFDELLLTIDTVFHFAARDNFPSVRVFFPAHVPCMLKLVAFVFED